MFTFLKPRLASTKTVRILGTHGVPADYGGFETAAENIGLFLASRGWRVIVYCQVPGSGPITYDSWGALERVNIPIAIPGWRGTSKFDLISILHASRYRDLCLTFGYNTGIFNLIQRLRRIPNVVNMDGIEWSRARWGFARQAILYINERASAAVANHLIADHPEIARYLASRAPRRKIATIAYGAHAVHEADETAVTSRGLLRKRYLTLICRPIPENSILELVKGFSQTHRGVSLAILGTYEPETDRYHREVQAAASDEVRFLGSIYEQREVEALRYNSLAYLHGHTVGGTNPSLVEAMAAGNPVIAHDNPYNRWVVGEGARYFLSSEDVAAHLDRLLVDTDLLTAMGQANRHRHGEAFTWEKIGAEYESLLNRFRYVEH
jgi:glycosyltransferase involved in cell wall biosynthesis